MERLATPIPFVAFTIAKRRLQWPALPGFDDLYDLTTSGDIFSSAFPSFPSLPVLICLWHPKAGRAQRSKRAV